MKVLVIGGGGREHAIAWKLKQNPKLTALYCAPGNAGTAEIAKNVEVDLSDIPGLARWAIAEGIDFTVVGPEAPLADGVVDEFEEQGLKIFGPKKAAARLESSKSFAKEVMLKAGVKTAPGDVFSDFESAKAYLHEHGAPIVVKADGLAAGKGVVVAETLEEAEEALENFMLRGKLGGSGETVVLEKRIVGREASVMAIVDGETIVPLVISQDYKRHLNGDAGPNTGGMGAISPTPVLGEEQLGELIETVFLPTVRELSARSIPYRGFLYAGMIVDEEGQASVLEFNCRLGDPETQVLLFRMESDLLDALYAAVTGSLSEIELTWKPGGAACVVAASKGYPEKPEDGKKLSGLFPEEGDVCIFQAGTKSGGSGETLTKGGRVLAVSGAGKTVEEALDRAYAGIEKISFEGMYYRTDIGRT